MGRASFRDRGPEVAAASPPRPAHISYDEHERIVAKLTKDYELKLLELRKRFGDLPEGPPAASAQPTPSDTAAGEAEEPEAIDDKRSQPKRRR